MRSQSKKPVFAVRSYQPSDFEHVAQLLKQMYDHIWIDLYHWKGMNLTDAREAVRTDCLVPDVHVFVVEHGSKRRLVGFISFSVRSGGCYHVEYLWVRKPYRRHGYEEKLLKTVEEHAQKEGHDVVHTFVNLNVPEEIEFFLHHGYKVVKALEIAKYFKEPAYISGKDIRIVGYKFKLR